MESLESKIKLARLLVQRLERLSADSLWARRASGARGNLLKLLDDLAEDKVSAEDMQRLDGVMDFGFEMLVRAGREIPYLEPGETSPN